jgi:hypothetical protein
LPKRTITDEEIGLIKAMLLLGMKNKDIQFFFNRQDRPVNSGRITGIRDGTYGPEIRVASEEESKAFMANFRRSEIISPLIVTATAEEKPSNPTSDQVLRTFFTKEKGGTWRCMVGESYEFECKESFNLNGLGKLLKTIAGFANNRGGYIFFGVKDKPDGFAVCGLQGDRFASTDQSKFTQVIRGALEPTPHFRITILELDSLKVGVIHVETHSSKPVIAGKTEGDLKEGFIYYRYPGETRAICYSDLRTILDERVRQSFEEILPMVQRLIELGPQNAMVANLADGQLEGGKRSILIDPKSLEQIKFIREGEFDEVGGAPTLRVIGEAQTTPIELVQPTRTVREEVTVEAILSDFIEKKKVERPSAYFNQSSREQAQIWPIYYYLHIDGRTRKQAIDSLNADKSGKFNTRKKFIELLNGKKRHLPKATGERLATLNAIRTGASVAISNLDQAINVAHALSSIVESDRNRFEEFHDLLGRCLSVWRNIREGNTLLYHIRLAAARLDELEYGPQVPIE